MFGLVVAFLFTLVLLGGTIIFLYKVPKELERIANALTNKYDGGNK